MKLFAIVGLLGTNAIRTSQDNVDVVVLPEIAPSEAKAKSINDSIEEAGVQLQNEKEKFEKAKAAADHLVKDLTQGKVKVNGHLKKITKDRE